MFFHRPKLTLPHTAATVELLREALAEYDVEVGEDECGRQLQDLNMDDIDLVEAIQLVEAFVRGRISKLALKPTTTLGELAAMLDAVRQTPKT